MNRYELSKLDFEALNEALMLAHLMSSKNDAAKRAKLEQLRDKFRAAHTGWLEIEE